VTVAPRMALLATGFGTVPLSLVLGSWWPWLAGPIPLAAIVGTFYLAHRWGLLADHRFLALWVGGSAILAVASVVTGLGNGLTDEPNAMPALIGFWPNLYGHTVTVSFSQVGPWPGQATPETQTWSYVYLPLLVLFQAPNVGYRYVSLLAWAILVFLFRNSGAGLVLMGAPWVALLAANGFTDFIPLVFLTLAMVTLRGPYAKGAEVVALALKQFANVLLVGYYIATRRWLRAAVACAVTAAVILPFVAMDPGGFWCNAVAGCSPASRVDTGLGVLTHANYCVWPAFALVIAGPGFSRSLRARWRR